MAWDDDKATAADPDNPAANEQLTADEWDAHVTEGHFPANELNFSVDSGDPVLTDPQNADEIIARYDRSEGTWIIDKLGTGTNPVTVNADTVSADQNPIFQLDDNSPADHSGSSSFSYTLSGEYDIVKLIIHNFDTDYASGAYLDLQVNGESGSTYSYFTLNGSNSASEDGVQLLYARDGFGSHAYVTMDGRWIEQFACNNQGSHANGSVAMVGSNATVTSPLTSLSLIHSAGQNWSADIEVYGRDLK